MLPSLPDGHVPAKGFLPPRKKSRSGPLYHLSHGQREPDGFVHLCLSKSWANEATVPPLESLGPKKPVFFLDQYRAWQAHAAFGPLVQSPVLQAIFA
jgi:hypothetical protein